MQMPLMVELVPQLINGKKYEAMFIDVTALIPARMLQSRASPRPDGRRGPEDGAIEVRRRAWSGCRLEDGNEWSNPYVEYYEECLSRGGLSPFRLM